MDETAFEVAFDEWNKKKKKILQVSALSKRKLALTPPLSAFQGGSFLASPFLKGFLAGYVVARLRSSALMGVAVGTCTGIYAAQTYKVPDIESTVREYVRNLRGGSK